MGVVNCPSAADLERLFLGDVPETQAQAHEEHVRACGLCLEKLKTLSRMRDALAGLLSEQTHTEEFSSSPVLAGLMTRLKSLRSASAGHVPQENAMILTCTSCQKKLSVKDALAGKKVKCPGCGQILTAPVPVAVPAGDRTLPPDPQPASPAPPVAPSNRPTHSGSNVLDSTAADVKKPDSGHDPSLTNFLSPPQSGDELGRLGKYRILKILGHGGMGVVYMAEDPLLKRTVALKAILPGLAASATAGQRFLREAQSMAQVEHDHIVRVHEVNEERGVSFLAMEFLKGEPLDVRLQREEKLPVLEAVRIGREIAEGLHAAHEHGLVHRDIKPGNIWLEAPRKRVKILDFGLARSMEQESGLTQQGAIVGTPAYMAPEQARGDVVDARSDLFSLGVILYRLCCGKQPFQGRDAISMLMAVATEEPAPLILVNPDLPTELSDLVMQLLQKEPERRPASAAVAAEALQALERKLLHAQELHEQTTLLRSPPQVEGPPRKRRFVVGIATGFLAATVVLAGIVIIIRNRQGEETARISVPDGSRVEIVDQNAKADPPRRGTIDDAWFKQVAALPAAKQVEAVVARLKEGNPGFDGKVVPLFDNGEAIALRLQAYHLKDLSALLALPRLQSLQIQGGDTTVKALTDLSTLKGLKLKELRLFNMPVSDLSPLKGMPLTWMNCTGSKVFDLSPLKDLPLLTGLFIDSTQLSDLSPLKGMKLTYLHCTGKSITDLSPLKGMPLTKLELTGTQVSDLSPLKGMPLTWLDCHGTRVSDLSSLKGQPLTWLNIDGQPVFDLSPLKGMKLAELHISGTSVSDLTPLKEMKLTTLTMVRTPTNDLSPLKGMPLSSLDCSETKVSDLSPLKGMPLTRLTFLNTPVSDLSPLKGMPLTCLHCRSTPVSDLLPLKGMPLKDLVVDFPLLERNAEILRSIKTLQNINGKPAAQFWKEVEAKAANKKS
jgi:serine/threonine protein kinase/Leucine-rich repeat (LRR) protein